MTAGMDRTRRGIGFLVCRADYRIKLTEYKQLGALSSRIDICSKSRNIPCLVESVTELFILFLEQCKGLGGPQW